MPDKVHLAVSAFDKAINTENTKNYKLSIQLSLDGFSFCILDTERNKYLGIESYDFQGVSSFFTLKNILSEHVPKNKWLKKPYNSVSIIFENPKTTLVPMPLFDPKQTEKYLDFNHTTEINDVVKFDHLPNLDAVNVYSIPENILNCLMKNFPDAGIHHFAGSLIETLLIKYKNRSDGHLVFANIRKSWFDIIVLKNRQMIYFNSFKYKASEDFVYFLIYVFEQINLNPEENELILTGNILKMSSLFEITFKYIRKVSFAGRNNNFDYSYVFDEIQPHFYYNLLNLQMCEL